MIASPSFKNQTMFVLGLGRSGQSVAQSLLKAGAHIIAWDDQETSRKRAYDQGIPLANLETLEWKNVDHFILSPGIPHHYPSPHPLVLKAQSVGLQPISDLEILYRTQPHGRYIGITGTNGKSTTTSLIAHILKENGHPVEVGGNLGIPVMDLRPLNEDGIYVLEISSYQLETSPSLHFNVSILLNITPDHLDRHGGMEGYIDAKKLIYKNATSQDTLIVSVDDEHCSKIYETLKKSGKVHLIPISISDSLSSSRALEEGVAIQKSSKRLECDVAHAPRNDKLGRTFDSQMSGKSGRQPATKGLPEGIYVVEGILYESSHPIIDLKRFERLRGNHNWQNIAAAYGALRSMGMDSDKIAKGVASFPGLAHRQQVVAHYKNVVFVNDSKATNSEAVEKALLSYEGVPIYWLLGGKPKEGGITNLIPYFSKIKHAFLFGEATALFSATLKGHIEYTACESLEEAVKKASAMAFNQQQPFDRHCERSETIQNYTDSGLLCPLRGYAMTEEEYDQISEAVVLLSPACASFDQFKDFEARGVAFCEAVKQVIEGSV